MSSGAADRIRGPVVLVSDSSEFGGAESYAAVLAAELRDRCEFVALLPKSAAAETREELTRAGAAVRTIPGLGRRPTPLAVIRLVRDLRRLEPALVHVNLTDQGAGLAAIAAAALAGQRRIGTLHLVIPDRTRSRERLSGFALRRLHRVVGVSSAVSCYLRDLGADEVVVRDGLPSPRELPDPRGALGLPTGASVVGGVGRLHEQKGWDVLCAAAGLVRRARPDTMFVVVGRGPIGDALKRLPECGEVIFTGYRPGAASLIAGFDVLAVPSRYEGLGLTAVEALLQGTPVVASDLAPLREVCGDCALFVPPNEPRALADAILELLADSSLREDLARRGRERATELFSAERMAAETLAVYRSVVGDQAEAGTTVQSMDENVRDEEASG